MKSIAELKKEINFGSQHIWNFTYTYSYYGNYYGTKVESLSQTNGTPVPTIESLQRDLERRDNYIKNLIETENDSRKAIESMTSRVAYLTTLLLAINESETTKAQWEELLMTLQLTVPDRLEINTRLKHVDPQKLMTFLDDEDLK